LGAKETCLLALLVRNSPKTSCCPVSQKEEENPEGSKTGLINAVGYF